MKSILLLLSIFVASMASGQPVDAFMQSLDVKHIPQGGFSTFVDCRGCTTIDNPILLSNLKTHTMVKLFDSQPGTGKTIAPLRVWGRSNVVSFQMSDSIIYKVFTFQYQLHQPISKEYPDFGMWAPITVKCEHIPSVEECADYMLSLDKHYRRADIRFIKEDTRTPAEKVGDIIPTKK